MNIRERIYENTKALAKAKGLSMKEIEDAIGVTTGYLSKVSKRLSIDKIEKLVNVLGVSFAELLETRKWIDHTYADGNDIECPFCHKKWNVIENCTETFDYCPGCGAKLS